MNEKLRAELIEMANEDLNTREKLLRSGNLPKNGYSEEMKRIHEKNNFRMHEIIEQYGWTGNGLVGEDGCEAAWLVVQHAVLEPEFQRRCLSLLEQAVTAGDAPGWQLAYLTDRVLMFEGKDQIYGTQFVPVEGSKSISYKIADAENVDARRLAVGLSSLEEHTKRIHREDELLSEKR